VLHRTGRLRAVLAALPLLSLTLMAAGPAVAADKGPLSIYQHLVVIYEENHSFDNLYGLWGDLGGQGIDGLPQADLGTTQIAQNGDPYTCLKQLDVNLNTDFSGSANPAFPPNTLSKQAACNPETVTFPDASTVQYTSHFLNEPFNIDQYIPADATTCPRPNKEFSFGNGIMNGAIDPTTGQTYGTPGGCTRDLVHKFYQEQYQLDGGAQDLYVTGSDSVGTAMGYYDTTALPIYEYLHGRGAPKYVIADHFFQAAFGGSYLNHQYLIAAQPLLWPSAPSGQHAVLDSAGIPHAYPLLKPDRAVVDGAVTQACDAATTVAGLACGNWAINTLQPPYEPQGSFGAAQPATDDSSVDLNIGDRMSDAGINWAWYAGGWDNAAGLVGAPGWTNGTGPTCSDPNVSTADKAYPFCPDSTFQFHHQPFNYFTRYAPGTADRAAHLKDEVEFIAAAQNGSLPQVSFVKPLGNENEHPGYSSEPNGSDHLVDLIKAVETGPQAGNTLIVVTYDEFGGSWDHVPPPGMGSTTGPHDLFGPGTRIPAVLIARSFTTSGVDSTVYDTTSIMATIEHQFGLQPVAARTPDASSPAVVPRDSLVADLGNAVAIGRKSH